MNSVPRHPRRRLGTYHDAIKRALEDDGLSFAGLKDVLARLGLKVTPSELCQYSQRWANSTGSLLSARHLGIGHWQREIPVEAFLPPAVDAAVAGSTKKELTEATKAPVASRPESPDILHSSAKGLGQPLNLERQRWQQRLALIKEVSVDEGGVLIFSGNPTAVEIPESQLTVPRKMPSDKKTPVAEAFVKVMADIMRGMIGDRQVPGSPLPIDRREKILQIVREELERAKEGEEIWKDFGVRDCLKIPWWQKSLEHSDALNPSDGVSAMDLMDVLQMNRDITLSEFRHETQLRPALTPPETEWLWTGSELEKRELSECRRHYISSERKDECFWEYRFVIKRSDWFYEWKDYKNMPEGWKLVRIAAGLCLPFAKTEILQEGFRELQNEHQRNNAWRDDWYRQEYKRYCGLWDSVMGKIVHRVNTEITNDPPEDPTSLVLKRR